ncbi:hypothetical protein OG943_40445 [Amycolatopsis sp. NBC_00345]|uniref:hypothetical protein n=1 Tax=Amycolatopsis sp. NBC_00345 TaxID=2975955 RepID=UPI002E25FE45
MSLDYRFNLATALSPEEFAREVLGLGAVSGMFDGSVTPELITTDGAVTARKAWTRAYKHDAINEQMDDVVRLSARMLERLSDDAILTGLDVPERLAELPEPYRRVTHNYG